MFKTFGSDALFEGQLPPYDDYPGQDDEEGDTHLGPLLHLKDPYPHELPQPNIVRHIPASPTPRTPAQRTAPATPRPINNTAPSTSYNNAQSPLPKDNFSLIPMAYSELWPSLLENHLVVAISRRVFQPPYPKWYDPGAKCAYHSGAPGNNIDSCRPFKYKVQHLINAGWLSFQEEGPNVKTNPLASHGKARVNAIQEGGPSRARRLGEVATSRRFIYQSLQEACMVSRGGGERDECLFHLGESHDMETCPAVEELLQRLMDCGQLEMSIGGREEPQICMQSEEKKVPLTPKALVICFTRKGTGSTPIYPRTAPKPTPFAYQSNKAVPWKYTPPAFSERVATEVDSLSAKVTNITGLSGVTRSGRVFASPHPAEFPSKGKAPMVQEPTDVDPPVVRGAEKKEGLQGKTVTLEEVHEFLRLIQQSEFKVVEQLNKTPARISLLELLINSEPHRTNRFEPRMGLGKDDLGNAGMVDIKGNPYKYGLGYESGMPGRRNVPSRLRADRVWPGRISQCFTSAGMVSEEEVAAIEEEFPQDPPNFVQPCHPDSQVGNWHVISQPEVYTADSINPARLGELGGKLLPQFSINRGRSEVKKGSAPLALLSLSNLLGKIFVDHVFSGFFRRFPQINVGGDFARIPFVEHASRESRVALPPKDRLRQLATPLGKVSDLLDYSEPSSRVFLFENILLLVVPTAAVCSSKGIISLETIKRDMTTLGVITKCLVISMGTNQTGKRFYQVKVKGPDTTSIKEVGRLMEPLQMQAFRKIYGKILELTIAEISIEAIASLTQYYDQPLRCFTFGDFQLVPTIEEFEEILGCPLGGRKPYLSSGCLPSLSRIATVVKDSGRGLDCIKQTRNGIAGLPRRYLEDKARGMANQGDWVPFMDVLASLIFGVVLFPNVDGLVDLAAIDAFLAYHHSKESPVVVVLADLFDTFNRRCEKSSARIICCLPALCVWLVSHLFQQDTRHSCPLQSHRSCTEKRRIDWDQLLAGIGGRTINWFPRWKEGKEGVLFSCGGYPNIPLIGMRGCINYNPALAIRQLGYSMRGAPMEESMSPFLVRDFGAQNFKAIQRIHKAWETPLRKDQEHRGIRNGIIGGYYEWLKVHIRGLDWLAKSKRSLSQRLCETETNMLAIIAKYQEELGLATAHEHRVTDEYAQVYAEKEARGRAMLGMRQLMEKNVATAAAVSSAAEADPTLLATAHHPPSNIMITMMVDTLPVFYYEKLVGYMPSNFADLVFAGGRIEVGLKRGKFDYVSSTSANAKRIGTTGAKRKEGDAHAVSSTPAWVKPPQTPHGTHQYAQHHPSFSVHTENASSSAPVQPKAPTQREAPQVPTPNTTRPTGNFNATRNFPPRPFQEFTPLPMTYEDLLPSLIANHLAVVTPGKVLQPPFPKWYDPNATCKYHGGVPGHSIEKCMALKYKVQHLIDVGWLTFQEDRPNVRTNPLANHGGGAVNAVESDRPRRSKPLKDVATPRRFIFEALQKGGVIPHNGCKEDSCLLHSSELHDMETCLGVEELLQRMIDQGRLEVGSEGREEQHICMQSTDGSSVAKPKPLVIYFTKGTASQKPGHPLAAKPVPFPYQNSHAIPSRYTPPREKEEEATDVSSLSAKVTNITGLSGVTRSGRVFAPPDLPVQPSNVKGKGKVVEEQDGEAPHASNKDIPAKGLPEKKDGKKEVSLEEASEFLRIIQQSEFKGLVVGVAHEHRASSGSAIVMMARVMLGNGYEPGMGLGKDNGGITSLINAKGNRGKYGLGYKPTQADIKRSITGRKSGGQSSRLRQESEGSPPCHISRSFISAGLGDEGQVVAIYEDDVPSTLDLVRPCPPDFQLGNWRVEERPDIYAASIINERGFEALVLTLVSNLALICDHLSPSAQFMGCPKRLIKIEPKPTFTKICCGQDHLELPSGVGTKHEQSKPIKVRQRRGQDWPNLVLRNGCKWGWGHDRLIVAPFSALNKQRTSLQGSPKMAPRKLASKRSRKDKATEGTSSAPEYDSHRFRSVVHQQHFEAIKGWSFLRERRVQLRDDEYTDFQEEIGRRRWASLVTPMAKFDPDIVLELYANAWPTEEGVRDMRSWVRGQWIPFDADAIGQLLGYPLVLEEGQECEYGQRRNRSNGFDEEAITQLLCIPGQDFARTAAGRRVRIMRTNMTTLTQIWMTLLLSNILPTDHNSDLPLPKCQLVYAILTRMSIHVAQLIADAIYIFAGMAPTRHPLDPDKSNRALGFPALITGLCQSFGVPVAPSKVIRPPITRAFIEKYCTQRQAQGNAPLAADAPPPHQAGPAGSFDKEQYLRHLVRQQAANHQAHVQTYDCLYQLSLSLQSQGFTSFPYPTPDQFRAEVAWPGDWPEAPGEAPDEADEAREDEKMTDLLDFLGGSGAT
ncbi:hypothetical protein HKD37_04G010609 [Glycine soja]